MKKNLSGYDLVVIGGPVWAGSMSAPIRTYLRKFKYKFQNVAFYSTQNGSFYRKGHFDKMRILSGASPWATLPVSVSDLKNGNFKKLSSVFIFKLLHGKEKEELKTKEKKKSYRMVPISH